MSGPTPELKHIMVRAGAGAGKTTGLVNRVIEVVGAFKQSAGRAPRIVLTTFTRKATQELKERLIRRACEEKNGELLHFVSDPAQLQITTIHGLLSLFLRQVGHLAGLDSGFQIISEGEAGHLARLVLRETIVENASSLRWLEIYGFDRFLKMCRRFATLKQEQGELKPATLQDLEAIALSAGQEWARRFDHLIRVIKDGTDEKSWQTYASLLADFKTSWPGGIPHKDGVPRKPSRRKDREDLAFLDEAVAEVIEPFKKALDKAGWERESWPTFATEWSEFASIAEDFATRLMAHKEAQARFEMNDLELKTLEILRDKPFLATVFAESWDYWMIDEYQDTSPLQVEVLKALIGERQRYLVGDPQQSIYLFRGAEVGVFNTAERETLAIGGKAEVLEINYRSRPDLLAFINDFMQSVSSDFSRMLARTRAGDSEPRGACALMIHAPDRESEMKAIATRISQLLEGGARLEQICILGRTHRNLIEAARVLRSFGYPTHVHAARGFGGRREVLDAQALWKFLINPHDTFNLLLLLRSPWFNVADWTLAEWMKDRPGSLWRRIAVLEEVPEAVLRLRECLADSAQSGVVRAFENALCNNSFLDLSLANDPAGRKESNLWKLIHRAQSLEREGGDSLLAMLRGEGDDPMESNEGDAASAQEPNSINLMTIHGAKGLQFDHVIVTAMGETPQTSKTSVLTAEAGKFFFPVWSDAQTDFVSSLLDHASVERMRAQELAEFDRWLYVAVTRAKETLTLSWSETGRESWASRSAWFLRQPGTHAGKGYSYLLTESMPEPAPYRAGTGTASEVRNVFAEPKPEATSRRSVTDLIESKEQVKPSREDFIKRWQAQTLGTRIHRTLEALKFDPSVAEGDDEVLRIVREMKEPPLLDWITTGFAEWGFHVQASGRVVEGQIDLWTKVNGQIKIVDYKSGSPAFQEKAFQQLSLYGWALRKFGHKEPAEMLVIYPRTGKVARRPFTEALFQGWESVLSVAKT